MNQFKKKKTKKKKTARRADGRKDPNLYDPTSHGWGSENPTTVTEDLKNRIR